MITKKLVIEGLVQGVGYRVSMANKAEALGLSGWVRNRRDGTVEACVFGSEEAIDAIINWSKRGPQGAQVRNVTVSETTESPHLNAPFKIIPTQ